MVTEAEVWEAGEDPDGFAAKYGVAKLQEVWNALQAATAADPIGTPTHRSGAELQAALQQAQAHDRPHRKAIKSKASPALAALLKLT